MTRSPLGLVLRVHLASAFLPSSPRAPGPLARAVEANGVHVGRDERVRAGVRSREPEARLRGRVRGGGDVDAGHVRGAPQRRVQREAARVREQVEHAPSARELADPAAVLPLVEERARLLAAREVHDEGHAVFLDVHRVRRRGSTQDLVARRLALHADAQDQRLDPQGLERRPERLRELGHLRGCRVPVRARDGDGAVAIHDVARHPVPLAVEHAKGVRARAVEDGPGTAPEQARCGARPPERRVDRVALARPHAHGDRRVGIGKALQPTSARRPGHELHLIAGLHAVEAARDRRVPHPRMATRDLAPRSTACFRMTSRTRRGITWYPSLPETGGRSRETHPSISRRACRRPWSGRSRRAMLRTSHAATAEGDVKNGQEGTSKPFAKDERGREQRRPRRRARRERAARASERAHRARRQLSRRSRAPRQSRAPSPSRPCRACRRVTAPSPVSPIRVAAPPSAGHGRSPRARSQ